MTSRLPKYPKGVKTAPGCHPHLQGELAKINGENKIPTWHEGHKTEFFKTQWRAGHDNG